jgi:hypothetical protein
VTAARAHLESRVLDIGRGPPLLDYVESPFMFCLCSRVRNLHGLVGFPRAEWAKMNSRFTQEDS